MDQTQFNDIAPFTDDEAAAALTRLSNHPNVPWISKFIFRDQPETYLRDILRSIHTVDDFQKKVMSFAIEWVIRNSVHNFSYDGLSKLEAIQGKYLAMSNHRDIILDPAIMQVVLMKNNLQPTEICVGDNLLKQKSVELLIHKCGNDKILTQQRTQALHQVVALLGCQSRNTFIFLNKQRIVCEGSLVLFGYIPALCALCQYLQYLLCIRKLPGYALIISPDIKELLGCLPQLSGLELFNLRQSFLIVFAGKLLPCELLVKLPA